MTFGILALGYGSGVPGPIHDTPTSPTAGNTNFALIPNLEPGTLGRFEHYRKPDRVDADEEQSAKLPPGIRILGPAELDDDDRPNWLLFDSRYWLIDCGPETMLKLCGAYGSQMWLMPTTHNLEGIFLTHCHDDHSGGVKSLAYRTRFIDQSRKQLFYPSQLDKLVRSQTAELSYHNPTTKLEHRGIEFFYNVGMLEAGIPIEVGNPTFEIRPFIVDHNCFDEWGEKFPAHGYLVKTKTGKIVVFSGDTAEPIPASFFVNADVIVHDVQWYNDGSKNDHVHCPYKALRDCVPPEHRHKVLLTHTGHELPPEAIADGFQLFRGGSLLVIE